MEKKEEEKKEGKKKRKKKKEKRDKEKMRERASLLSKFEQLFMHTYQSENDT